jgi:hypothetical protein
MAKESQDPFDRTKWSGTTFTAKPEPFQVQSQGSIIKFLREGVQPPSIVYMGVGDVIQVTIMAGGQAITANVNGRWLRAADGAVVPFTFQFTASFTRAPTSNTFALGEGFLLSLNVVSSVVFNGTPIYGTVAMIRGGTTGAGVSFQQLAAGWFGGLRGLFWPGGTYVRPNEGPGVWRSITGATPAAGAEISETVPSQAFWRLYAFRFSLTTSATVATRNVSLRFDDGANVFDEAWPNLNQAQGVTAPYTFSNNAVPSIPALSTNINVMPLDDTKLLPGGFRIRTNTFGIQVGDQYTAPQYLVQEWYAAE